MMAARPYSAMLGGICCTPMALRTSDSTTVIFTKEVVITTISGMSATSASAKARSKASGVFKAHPGIARAQQADVRADASNTAFRVPGRTLADQYSGVVSNG